MTADDQHPRVSNRFSRVRWAGLVPLLCTCALVVAACQAPEARALAAIERAFPTIEDLGVQGFFTTDECQWIRYSRGEFATGCDDVGGIAEGLPVIDREARRDIEAIFAASEADGRMIIGMETSVDADGSIAEGRFRFGRCRDYVYEPGFDALPDYDSEHVERLNEDWFVVVWCL